VIALVYAEDGSEVEAASRLKKVICDAWPSVADDSKPGNSNVDMLVCILPNRAQGGHALDES
jgi:hypothetical protein